MNLEQAIAFLAVLIQLIGVSFYIRAMVKKEVRPNRVSWMVWALAPMIGVWFAFLAGGRLSLLPVFMAGFGPVLVVIASFIIKNGYWKISKFDIGCGVLAILALVAWIVTRNLSIAIFFAILSDGLAALPTIAKAWTYPKSESAAAYLGGITANILGLIIVKEWSFPIYSMGVYFILLNLVIVFIIYRNKIYVRRNK